MIHMLLSRLILYHACCYLMTNSITTLVDRWNTKSIMMMRISNTPCNISDLTLLTPWYIPHFNSTSVSILKQGNTATAVNVNTTSLQ